MVAVLVAVAATYLIWDRETEVVRETRSYVAIDCLYLRIWAQCNTVRSSIFAGCMVCPDLQQRTGTAFMLSDSLAAEFVGCWCW